MSFCGSSYKKYHLSFLLSDRVVTWNSHLRATCDLHLDKNEGRNVLQWYSTLTVISVSLKKIFKFTCYPCLSAVSWLSQVSADNNSLLAKKSISGYGHGKELCTWYSGVQLGVWLEDVCHGAGALSPHSWIWSKFSQIGINIYIWISGRNRMDG